MIIELLRAVKGYITFEASGGFPERFLNLCRMRGIVLWNVKNDGVKVSAFTNTEDLPKLNEPAERSGMKLIIIKECGLKHFIKCHKRRCGLAFGALAAAACVALLSTMVWQIDVIAEDGVNVEDFTESLAELGVYRGAFKSKIDILEVQRALVEKYPQLVWVSLNIFGGRAEVEMSVAVPVPEIVDTETPANVVAAKAGTITLVGLRAGTLLVKEGMFVPEGELLISCVAESVQHGEHLCRADGFVNARTETVFSKTAMLSLKRDVVSECKSRYGLYFFGIRLTPFFYTDEKYASEYTHLADGKKALLPFGTVFNNSLVCEKSSVELSVEAALCGALCDCVYEKRAAMNEASVDTCTCKITGDDEGVTVVLRVQAVENIARLVPVEVSPDDN